MLDAQFNESIVSLAEFSRAGERIENPVSRIGRLDG
jgi:hypothetical protein